MRMRIVKGLEWLGLSLLRLAARVEGSKITITHTQEDSVR